MVKRNHGMLSNDYWPFDEIQKFLEIARQRASDAYLTPRHRVQEFQFSGVQHQTCRLCIGSIRSVVCTIKIVAKNRQAAPGEMYSNLVRPPGPWDGLDPDSTRMLRDHTKGRLRKESIRLHWTVPGAFRFRANLSEVVFHGPLLFELVSQARLSSRPGERLIDFEDLVV